MKTVKLPRTRFRSLLLACPILGCTSVTNMSIDPNGAGAGDRRSEPEVGTGGSLQSPTTTVTASGTTIIPVAAASGGSGANSSTTPEHTTGAVSGRSADAGGATGGRISPTTSENSNAGSSARGGTASGGDGTVEPATGGSASGGAATGGAATGGAATGGAATGGAPVACPSSHDCVPSAPSGWTGPVLISNSASSCPGTFPTLVLSGGSNADRTGQCECQCAPPTSSECSNQSIITSYFYSDASCGAAADDTIEYPAAECFNGFSSSQVAAMGFAVAAPVHSCGAGSYQKPATSFVSPFIGCTAPTGNWQCIDETQRCLPKKNFANTHEAICVYKSGDTLSCPAPYDNAPVRVFTGLAEQRSCPSGSCTCTGAGGICEANVTLYTGTNCAGAQVGNSALRLATTPRNCFTNLPEVTGINSFAVGSEFTHLPGSGVCVGTSVAPSGTISPTGITSLCCLSTLD